MKKKCKKMCKRIFALVLSMVMLLSFSLISFADEVDEEEYEQFLFCDNYTDNDVSTSVRYYRQDYVPDFPDCNNKNFVHRFEDCFCKYYDTVDNFDDIKDNYFMYFIFYDALSNNMMVLSCGEFSDFDNQAFLNGLNGKPSINHFNNISIQWDDMGKGSTSCSGFRADMFNGNTKNLTTCTETYSGSYVKYDRYSSIMSYLIFNIPKYSVTECHSAHLEIMGSCWNMEEAFWDIYKKCSEHYFSEEVIKQPASEYSNPFYDSVYSPQKLHKYDVVDDGVGSNDSISGISNNQNLGSEFLLNFNISSMFDYTETVANSLMIIVYISAGFALGFALIYMLKNSLKV